MLVIHEDVKLAVEESRNENATKHVCWSSENWSWLVKNANSQWKYSGDYFFESDEGWTVCINPKTKK